MGSAETDPTTAVIEESPGADVPTTVVATPPNEAVHGDAPAAGRPSGRSWTTLLLRAWAPVLLFLVAFGANSLTVASHTSAFSPVDEYVYYDYLVKVPTEGWVKMGEYTGLDAREHMSCSGVLIFGVQGPPCHSDYTDSAKYVQDGKTSASSYTPAYFWPTYVAGTAFSGVLGVSSLTGFRLAGGLWLGAAMVVFFFLLRQFRINRLIVFGLGFCLIASPFVWVANTFISTDGSVLLCAALMLLTAIKVARHQWPAWLFVLFALVSSALKVTNLVGIGVASLVLVFLALSPSTYARRCRAAGHAGTGWRSVFRPIPRSLGAVVFALLLAGVVQIAWTKMQAVTRVSSSPSQGVTGASLSPKRLVSLAMNMVSEPIVQQVSPPGKPNIWLYPMPDSLTLGLSALCVIGAFAPLLIRSGPAALLALRWPLALGSVTGAVGLALSMAIIARYYPMPPRYAAGSIPGMFLMVGLITRSKAGKWLIFGFGVLVLAWSVKHSINILQAR